MSEGLRVLAVDDERPALEDLARLLRGSDHVAHVETASSGAAALAKLADRRFDAIFLDVRMPELDGLELTRVLRRFESAPDVVFVTAYDDAAVDAFELRAVDYLMKPVARPRLEETLARVRGRQRAGAESETATAPAEKPPGHDLVAARGRSGGTRLVTRSSILYVESAGDYVRLVCDDGRYLLRAHISDLERRWSSSGFVRVHRQYVANIARALELQPNLNGTASLVFHDGSSIPVSRRQVSALMQALAA